jgi:hypothetical protein
MITRSVLVAALLMGGCASQPAYQPPLPTLPSSPPVLPEPVVARIPPPDVLPQLPPEDPVKASMAALREGIIKPRREWFKGVTYAPPYHPNHSYLIYIPEGNGSVFQFSPGEQPDENGATCPDGGSILDESWSSTGVGPGKSWLWTVKVRMTAPAIQCSLTTNRGPYIIVIQPTTKTHISKIQFSDPYSFLSEADPETPEICPKMDVNYVLTGNEGAFGLRPGDISNNGKHTCIRFPQSAAFDLPAAWLVEGDKERPATPATIDNAYVIDGVPPVIELRTDSATLRIERAHP